MSLLWSPLPWIRMWMIRSPEKTQSHCQKMKHRRHGILRKKRLPPIRKQNPNFLKKLLRKVTLLKVKNLQPKTHRTRKDRKSCYRSFSRKTLQPNL